MSARVTVRELTEPDYEAWNALVATSRGGSIYSTPEYLEVLAAEAGGRFTILGADRGGELAGGIALLERRNAWGTYVQGRYLLYYNGFVLKDHPSKYPSERTAKQTEVLKALAEAVASRGYGRVKIRSRELADIRVFMQRGWWVEPSYTYVAPLNDLKELWGRVEQNLRRLVNRCGQQGIQFTQDADFPSFQRLHLATTTRKAKGVYLPGESFERYFRRLRERGLCRLYHARLPDGRAISSQLVLLGKHPVTHSVCAASDLEHLKTGATAFLRWKVFEDLASLGYQANDLTDAELNPVTHFKSQLGGDLQLNLVLSRPDRPAFMVQRLIAESARLGSAAAARINRSLADLRTPQQPEQRPT